MVGDEGRNDFRVDWDGAGTPPGDYSTGACIKNNGRRSGAWAAQTDWAGESVVIDSQSISSGSGTSCDRGPAQHQPPFRMQRVESSGTFFLEDDTPAHASRDEIQGPSALRCMGVLRVDNEAARDGTALGRRWCSARCWDEGDREGGRMIVIGSTGRRMKARGRYCAELSEMS